jgi:hypothetical protein
MDKTRCRGCPKNVLNVNFVKTRLVETYVRKVILISCLRTYYRSCVKFCVHVMQREGCEFYKGRRREGCTLRMNLGDITFICVP